MKTIDREIELVKKDLEQAMITHELVEAGFRIIFKNKLEEMDTLFYGVNSKTLAPYIEVLEHAEFMVKYEKEELEKLLKEKEELEKQSNGNEEIEERDSNREQQ